MTERPSIVHLPWPEHEEPVEVEPSFASEAVSALVGGGLSIAIAFALSAILSALQHEGWLW